MGVYLGGDAIPESPLPIAATLASPAKCSPWGLDFHHLCSEADFEPDFDPCYRTADFAALQAIVATGRGLTLVPEMALTGTPNPGTVVRRLEGGPIRQSQSRRSQGSPSQRRATR